MQSTDLWATPGATQPYQPLLTLALCDVMLANNICCVDVAHAGVQLGKRLPIHHIKAAEIWSKWVTPALRSLGSPWQPGKMVTCHNQEVSLSQTSQLHRQL